MIIWSSITRFIQSRLFFVSLVVIMSIMICLPPDGFAKNAASSTSKTHLLESSLSASELQNAKLWQLNQQEWQLYKSLMQGPRGIWSPDLDPLSVLGIAAINDSERKYFAEKLAKLEHARLQQELLFEAAYQSAQKKLFGNVPLFANNQPFANRTPLAQQRRLYFVKLPCDSCKQQLASLLTKLSSTNMQPLDIYLQKSNGLMTDAQIRQWATQMAIPTTLVTSRKVTLNHDNGLAKQAGITQFPALMQKRSKSWSKQTTTGAKQ